MIIYYPTYYLVPVVPVMLIDEDEYRAQYNNEYRQRFSMEGNKVYNAYRNINGDIFGEIDEEYVNESTK
jgi:hypothetical protein